MTALAIQASDPSDYQRVLQICRAVSAAGGRAVLVGGAVRNALMGREVEDFDLEVFGLPGTRVRSLVEADFEVDAVGESFAVLKLRRHPIDVALPRRERKTGPGHRGFDVVGDPDLSFAEAAQRRDFTVNAISWDPLVDDLIDPLDGAADLAEGLLRHASHRFSEDPLRVLRAMQFAARFSLRVAPETLELCRRLDASELPRERLWGEWRKMILAGERISIGLEFLRDSAWLRYFPEIEALIGCEQDPQWHPEGDVWVHTLAVMDAFAAARIGDPWEDTVVGFACLCHDLGKPATTVRSGGRIRSRGHEEAGVGPTRDFLARLTEHAALAEAVVPLVREHLKPRQLWQAGAGDAAVRRLARRVGRIDRLVRVAQADADGRPPLPQGEDEAGRWLLDKARQLDVESRAPEPLILGRHLIERGLQPGPDFGPLLERCFEAQLRGDFSTLEKGLGVLDRILETRGARSGKP